MGARAGKPVRAPHPLGLPLVGATAGLFGEFVALPRSVRLGIPIGHSPVKDITPYLVRGVLEAEERALAEAQRAASNETVRTVGRDAFFEFGENLLDTVREWLESR